MGVRASLLNDAKKFLFDNDTFAEPVTYYPHVDYGGTATSRSINAVVIRQQIVALDADGGETVVPAYEVHVANDSTVGISSTEINTGGDQIALPVREGKAAERRSIIHVASQDHGALVLTCQ